MVSGTCQRAESLYLDESDAFIHALPVIVLLRASIGSQTWNTTIKIIIMQVLMLMIMMKTFMALILITTTTATNRMAMTMLLMIMVMIAEIIKIL